MPDRCEGSAPDNIKRRQSSALISFLLTFNAISSILTLSDAADALLFWSRQQARRPRIEILMFMQQKRLEEGDALTALPFSLSVPIALIKSIYQACDIFRT